MSRYLEDEFLFGSHPYYQYPFNVPVRPQSYYRYGGFPYVPSVSSIPPVTQPFSYYSPVFNPHYTPMNDIPYYFSRYSYTGYPYPMRPYGYYGYY